MANYNIMIWYIIKWGMGEQEVTQTSHIGKMHKYHITFTKRLNKNFENK